MDPTRLKLILSLALGLLAAGLGWFFLNSREQQLLDRAKQVEVIVADHYIPAYTRLDETLLAKRKIPNEYLSKGSMTSLEEVQGMLTLAPFSSGEPILFNKLARTSQSLASAVPEGRRAYSIAVDQVSGVAGLIRPGDFVDVLLLTEAESGSRQSLAATLFQASRVVAVGNQYGPDEKGQAEGGSTVTLALTPQECEIALFAQSRGRLHLTLRPTGEKQFVEIKPAEFSTVLSRVNEGLPKAKGQVMEIIRGTQKDTFEIKKR